MTAQADFYDAQLRHHIDVQRFSAGNVRKVLALLRKSDKELLETLNSRVDPGDFTSRRYKALLADVRATRQALMRSIGELTAKDLTKLATAEQMILFQLLTDSVPVRLDFAVADAARLEAIITQHPFTAGGSAARTLDQWWAELGTADANRITSALQYGLLQGETIGQITQRVQQATSMTRHNAEAVARTATNHASNTSRNEFFRQNGSVVSSLMWSSTLDGRTTVICMSLDGHYAPTYADSWDGVPQPHLETMGQRPPAHVQCRSYMVGILNAAGIAQMMPDRPFVRDARTREWREKDFRAEARTKVGAREWKAMSTRQRNAEVRQIRNDWATANIGTVPARTTYAEWLAKQSRQFQNDVLGEKRAEMFRSGMTLDKFVDRKGGELTLKALLKKNSR